MYMETKNKLWEEKNLTEPKPNCESNQTIVPNDGINETKSPLEKSECSDIGKRKYNLWTSDDISKLKHLYLAEGKSASELTNYFPNRTCDAINLKITRLKLRHTKEQQYAIWSRLRLGDKNPCFGKSPPTKGHTKHDMQCLKVTSEKVSLDIRRKIADGTYRGLTLSGKNNPMYGKIAWSRGLTIYTSDILKSAGRKNSISQKEIYKLMSPEERLKVKEKMARIGSKKTHKKKDTSIELKIGEYLTSIGVSHMSNHVHSIFTFDFYIPSVNLVIECQGDYWHCNPLKYSDKIPDKIQIKNMERDSRKVQYLKDNGFRSLFIWEYDINRNFENVKLKILNMLNYDFKKTTN